MASSDDRPALPGTRHKVLGLVSGGKDSCFNLMHAVANGHDIVALATLTPAPGIDELDSHMYQSVGTSIPPLIAQAMGLPHYRRVIKGKSVQQGAEYGSREAGGEGQDGDETEDLTMLLRDVLREHPDITAVASGAILSNYQRLRIEHVCQRLGLTSLAYLWQSEQLPLVASMISNGLNAILVKVAGAGLGEKQVGKSLAQLFPLLTRLQAQYGAHPAGEGGEYETLTLDTPLFSHRISIDSSEVVVTDPEPYCVAYLRIHEASLEKKEGWVKPSVTELRRMLGLDSAETGREGLDEHGLELLEAIGDFAVAEGEPSSVAGRAVSSPGSVRFGRRGRWFAVSAEGEFKVDQDVGAEVRQCFENIKARLAAESLSLLHAAHITLLLSSMSPFPSANAAYVKYFGTSPPSRATVAVPLPPGQRIRVEVVGFDDSPGNVGGRSALHVQGLSYWAPANIGPYSQAVTANSRLHIAGQIPLQPASLTFAPYPAAPASPYPHQAALALQHVRRIVDVLRSPNSTGGGWSGWVESAVVWWARPEGCGSEGGSVVARKAWDTWAEVNDCAGAPVIVVQASELPRGALVEYQVNLHTGREDSTVSDASAGRTDDDDDEDGEQRPVYASGAVRGAHWSSCTAPGRLTGSRAALFLPDTSVPELAAEHGLADVLRTAVTVRVYHLPSVDPADVALLTDMCWTPIPVLDIQDAQGRAYPLALEVFSA